MMRNLTRNFLIISLMLVLFLATFSCGTTKTTTKTVNNTKETVTNIGITENEVSDITDTEHQLQLWKVLSNCKSEASYQISIKHAVAGAKGSFFITAWTDTNNDGKPDKEIGRSNLLTAQNKGDWSSWTFKCNDNTIFIGNTWSQSDEQIYYQIGGEFGGYKGLSSKMFYSRKFNSLPSQSTGPRYTNIKIKIITD
jgi:hypothetical protein